MEPSLTDVEQERNQLSVEVTNVSVPASRTKEWKKSVGVKRTTRRRV
jgi:hypothetical protein